MNKTVALTFTAAVVLLIASLTLNIYGHHVVQSQRATARELGIAIYCDHCETGLESWERASGLVGLLAFSVSIAGGMLWDREAQSRARRVSVLGLDERAARRIVGTPAPCHRAISSEMHVDLSGARSREEESLTPLERVIRYS